MEKTERFFEIFTFVLHRGTERQVLIASRVFRGREGNAGEGSNELAASPRFPL